MGTVTDEISGRTGRFTVTVSGPGAFGTLNAELTGEVVIKYGKMERSPARQVLKSYVQLAYIDPELELHEEFRGGFAPSDSSVVIEGPGVNWKGSVKQENRTIPFTNRISEERTILNCYGGITESRMSNPNEDALVTISQAFQLFFATEQLTLGAGCGERIRSDVEALRRDGVAEDVSEPSGTFVKPLNLYREDSMYEAVKSWGQISKGMIYRSLSENNIIWDSTRLIGTGGTFQGRDPGESGVSAKNRGEFIHEVEELLTGRDQDGLRDLDRVGSIIVQFDTDTNIGVPGAAGIPDPADSVVVWPQPDFQGGGIPLQQYWGTDASKNILIAVGTDGNQNNIVLNLGEINPSQGLGIILTWDQSEVQGTPSIDLEYRGNDGSTYNVSDASSNSKLEGVATTDLIDPIVRVTGTNAEVRLKVRYKDGQGRIVENLRADVSQSGVEDIEIENPPPAITVDSNGVDEYEPLEYRIPSLGISSHQPYLFQAALEREMRPFGTKSARGRLFGVYGPEWVHEINLNNATRYYVATGLAINLNTGITDAALVEVPPHTLS